MAILESHPPILDKTHHLSVIYSLGYEDAIELCLRLDVLSFLFSWTSFPSLLKLNLKIEVNHAHLNIYIPGNIQDQMLMRLASLSLSRSFVHLLFVKGIKTISITVSEFPPSLELLSLWKIPLILPRISLLSPISSHSRSCWTRGREYGRTTPSCFKKLIGSKLDPLLLLSQISRNFVSALNHQTDWLSTSRNCFALQNPFRR